MRQTIASMPRNGESTRATSNSCPDWRRTKSPGRISLTVMVLHVSAMGAILPAPQEAAHA